MTGPALGCAVANRADRPVTLDGVSGDVSRSFVP
jgi:hypothetical protein